MKGERSMKKKFAAGLTGAIIAGALAVSQLAPAVYAEDKETSLSVSETEAPETEAKEEETEKKLSLELLKKLSSRVQLTL